MRSPASYSNLHELPLNLNSNRCLVRYWQGHPQNLNATSSSLHSSSFGLGSAALSEWVPCYSLLKLVTYFALPLELCYPESCCCGTFEWRALKRKFYLLALCFNFWFYYIHCSWFDFGCSNSRSLASQGCLKSYWTSSCLLRHSGLILSVIHDHLPASKILAY